MTILWLIIIAAVSYLIGSISCAIIVGKVMAGDDIRSHGSGNAGATNALRTYGKFAALLVTLGDCLKSAVCCIVAILLSKYTPLGAENRDLAVYAAGFGSVLGHNFPLYFNFKGGKGILVSVTAYFFANWQISLVIAIISIAIMAITKYVSLGSVVGAVLFIIAAIVFETNNISYIIFTIILSSIAIYRHRENIKRLINGTESKLTKK